MHTTAHYSLGIIFASLSFLVGINNFWTFAFIVFCGFCADFDIIFLKFGATRNHRLFFTHTIYSPIIVILVGILSQKFWIIFGGLGYLSHILFDFFDWGVNLFYTGTLHGFRILFTKQERTMNPRNVNSYEQPQWFFIHRYYSSKVIIIIEFVLAIVSWILLLQYAIQFWYFGLGFIAAILLHVIQYRLHKPPKNNA